MTWYEIIPDRLIDISKMVYVRLFPDEPSVEIYFIGYENSFVFHLTEEQYAKFRKLFYGTV